MTVFARRRNAEYVTATLAVVDPKTLDKAAKQLRSLMFPEEKYDELDYVKKAQEMFEKLRKLDIRIYLVFRN